jgi:hypothetical protein
VNRDHSIAVIRGSGLADRLDRILPHLERGLRIRATRAPDADKTLVSRFAGNGVLPRGASRPSWDSSALHRRWIEYCHRTMGANKSSSRRYWHEQIARYEARVRDNPKPIHFLAMIRLADVATHAAQMDLPDRCALLFFCDVERSQGSFWLEARDGWQSIYAPDDHALVVDEPPASTIGLLPPVLSFEEQFPLPVDLRAETGDDDLCLYTAPSSSACITHCSEPL